MEIAVERVKRKNMPVTDKIQQSLKGQQLLGPGQRPGLPPRPSERLSDALPTNDPNEGLIKPKSFFSSFSSQRANTGTISNVPTVLKASGQLNEREQIETEAISNLKISNLQNFFSFPISILLKILLLISCQK